MQLQVHLKGKWHSNRGVRVKMLGPDEAAHILATAAQLTGDEAKIIEIKKAEWRLGVKQFIVAYTEPCQEITPETRWFKSDPATLDEKFDTLFMTKDCAVLEQMYRDFHEVNEKDVEAIAGKALPVSED